MSVHYEHPEISVYLLQEYLTSCLKKLKQTDAPKDVVNMSIRKGAITTVEAIMDEVDRMAVVKGGD